MGLLKLWDWIAPPRSRNDRLILIDLLAEEWLKADKDTRQFEEHAQRMVYPSFRQRLLGIAAEERQFGEWLRQSILKLGGEPPQASLAIKIGRNSWECLLADVEQEGRDSAAMLSHIYTVAERVDP